MTNLNINIAEFTKACKAARVRAAEVAEFEGMPSAFSTIHRMDIIEHFEEARDVVAPAPATAQDAAASLQVAARTKQQFGATKKQIGFIVSLAQKADEGFEQLTRITTLTKFEASMMINTMKEAA